MARRRGVTRSGRGNRRSWHFALPLISALIAVTALLSQTVAVSAAEIRSGDDPGVARNETIDDDLYLFGGDVQIAGTVNGDAIVSSGRLTMSGRIDGSLTVLAGDIDISGAITGSVRVAGGDVTITGPIDTDLVVATGKVTIEGNGSIGGDLLVAGGDVTVSSPVDGDIRGYVDTLTINENIGGDVKVKVDDLNLNADVEGDLEYTGPNAADLADGASVTGTRTHHEATNFSPGSNVTSWLLSSIFRLLCALFAGLILVLLIPRAAATVADGIRLAPASSFVLGLILLFVIPILVVILLITIVGIPVALILLVSYLCVLYLSQIILGLALGRIVLPKSWDTFGRGYNLLAMTLGVVFLGALRFIPVPFLGTAIGILTAIFGLGAVILGPRRWRTHPATAY